MWSKLLGAICTVVSYWFGDARQKELRKKKARERQNQIDHDVHSGDEDAVNAHWHGGKKLCIGFLFLALGLCGCASAKPPDVVYVNEPTRLYKMEREGVWGWWVPNVEMAQMLKERAACACR